MRKFENSLFHYTSETALFNIIKTQSFSASHYGFLNDTSELSLFGRVLVEYLFNKIHECSAINNSLSDPEKREGINDFYDVLHQNLFKTTLRADAFIASFCLASSDFIGQNGLLSQWRAYGANGGYAIEFDKSKILDRLKSYSDFAFSGECCYHLKNFEQAYGKELEIIKNYFFNLCQETKKGGDAPDALEVLPAFIKGCCFFKHEGFHEEKEFRIVLMLNVSRQLDDFNFRLSDGGKPFIEIFSGLGLPIKRIIVGPHAEKHKKAHFLSLFLKVNQLNGEIEVSVSDIPYV